MVTRMTRSDLQPGERIAVSACLLGLYCRYDGRCEPDGRVVSLAGSCHLVPVCPEQLGGLPTPRQPVELRNGRAMTADGRDLSAEFQRGVQQVEVLVGMLGIRVAVLQPRSPSCGSGIIYDGSFSGVRVPGDGLLSHRLKEIGIRVLTPEDLAERI